MLNVDDEILIDLPNQWFLGKPCNNTSELELIEIDPVTNIEIREPQFVEMILDPNYAETLYLTEYIDLYALGKKVI